MNEYVNAILYKLILLPGKVKYEISAYSIIKMQYHGRLELAIGQVLFHTSRINEARCFSVANIPDVGVVHGIASMLDIACILEDL